MTHYFELFICDPDQCLEETHAFKDIINAYHHMKGEMNSRGFNPGFIPSFRKVIADVANNGKYSYNGDYIIRKVMFEDCSEKD